MVDFQAFPISKGLVKIIQLIANHFNSWMAIGYQADIQEVQVEFLRPMDHDKKSATNWFQRNWTSRVIRYMPKRLFQIFVHTKIGGKDSGFHFDHIFCLKR